ncbi:MAG: hypothetical protein WKF35_07495 [Ferruginibacter sp.]
MKQIFKNNPVSGIDKLVDDTINSMDGHTAATPRPFLLTRLHARIRSNTSITTSWDRWTAFITRPTIALTGLLLVIILNVFIITSDDQLTSTRIVQEDLNDDQEIYVNTTYLYDIENIEP